MASKTPVTILQEFMVRRHETPTYDLICNEVGTHEPLFKYLVTGLGKTAVGSGKSKREAKHEAARLLLNHLNEEVDIPELKNNEILKEVKTCYSPYDDTIKDNAVGALQTFCCEYQLQDPKYELILDVGPPHFKQFTLRCTVSSFFCEATARTKKQAKHRCSNGLLQKLKLCLSDYVDSLDENCVNKTLSCELAKKTISLGHPISKLYNIFTTQYYPDSPTLKELNNEACRVSSPLNTSEVIAEDHSSDFPSLKDLKNGITCRIGSPLNTLKVIAEEMNFDLDIKEFSSVDGNVIVNIFLISKPGWSFITIGKDYETAVDAAALEVIHFLIIMSS